MTEPQRSNASWVRPALAALLVGTAVLYLWGLGASGTANDFYAAAVQAGTRSWKAFFFGSFDSGNLITVDKPPASLWVMELSGRIFGFSSWSMLVPQALEGVAAVWLLFATVRRWFGPLAGLIAGVALAITPVAVLMFRFNNPDALLTLVCVAAAYAVVRAVEKASWRWLALAGALLGFGFLTKSLQAFLVVPAFGLVYLVAAPVSLGRRIAHLGTSLAALVVTAGWWVAIVQLWPASSRPYIGGSTDNSVLNLAFGYNGLGRLTGNENGGGGPGGGGGGFPGGGGRGGGFGGGTGIGRLFGSEMGTQISWLLPAALIAFAGLLWLAGRAPRTDRFRAAAILYGGWLIVAGVVLSYMQGTVHPYYTIQLAPAIGALAGIGGTALWQRRSEPVARALLAAMVGATAVWDFVLLGRVSAWLPPLRFVVLVVGLAAAAALLAGAIRWRRGIVVAGFGAAIALVAALTGSAAFALDTAATPHTGSIPTAGPATQGGGFGGRFAGGFPGGQASGGQAPGGQAPGGQALGGQVPGGQVADGQVRGGGTAGGGFGGGAFGGGGGFAGGGFGGRGGGTQGADAQLVALLKKTDTRWSAATISSMSAAPLELGSDTAVMAIGGFTGSDPAPTLAQFQAYVKAGEVRYFVGSGGRGSAIASWVAEHYAATTVGGSTVYDLQQPATG